MNTGSEIGPMALADFGITANVNGASVTVIPCLNTGVPVQGNMLDDVGPYVLALKADTDAIDLYSGNDGETMTIDDVEYLIAAITPIGNGMVLIALEVQV